MRSGCAAALLVVLSCASQGELRTGNYRHYAASAELTDRVPETLRARLDTDAGSLSLRWGQEATLLRLGEVESANVCPGGASGRVTLLEPVPLVVAEAALARPALHSSCGEAAPKRLVIVDLAVRSADRSVQYSHWVELCASDDPDC